MEIYWGERSQAYVTPISAEEVCIVVMADHPEDSSFARCLAEWPELQRRLAHASVSSRERGAVSCMHSLRRVTRENVALVGDASGGVDAITGEGLHLAFRQGLLLADALEAGNLESYQRAHRKLFLRPTWMGKLMLSLGRDAKFRRRAIHSLAAKPQLFSRLLAVQSGNLSPAHLLATGAQLGWQFLAE
jgi:flavin-dependent dehydrogenase